MIHVNAFMDLPTKDELVAEILKAHEAKLKPDKKKKTLNAKRWCFILWYTIYSL